MSSPYFPQSRFGYLRDQYQRQATGELIPMSGDQLNPDYGVTGGIFAESDNAWAIDTIPGYMPGTYAYGDLGANHYEAAAGYGNYSGMGLSPSEIQNQCEKLKNDLMNELKAAIYKYLPQAVSGVGYTIAEAGIQSLLSRYGDKLIGWVAQGPDYVRGQVKSLMSYVPVPELQTFTDVIVGAVTEGAKKYVESAKACVNYKPQSPTGATGTKQAPPTGAPILPAGAPKMATLSPATISMIQQLNRGMVVAQPMAVKATYLQPSAPKKSSLTLPLLLGGAAAAILLLRK